MKKSMLWLSLFAVVFVLSGCTLGQTNSGNAITVYTERHYDTDQALYDLFEEETGIKVNILSAGADELINRLDREGEDTEADLLIIADAGRLHRAKTMDLLQPVISDTIEAQVPANYRDTDNYWIGLTKRARVLVYSPNRVSVDELSTYEALTDATWEGRVVTRTSSNIYNQSLMASFIETMGEDDARLWARGLVNNFAINPEGNDRHQAKLVYDGTADVAIMNTYYIGRMLNSSDSEERAVGEHVRVFFPNQGENEGGTHINISAAGVTKYASNIEGAQKLIEFLTSEAAQSEFANANYEYPVNPNVEPSELLKSWGEFIAQDINLSALGIHSQRATMIMTEEGWE